MLAFLLACVSIFVTTEGELESTAVGTSTHTLLVATATCGEYNEVSECTESFPSLFCIDKVAKNGEYYASDQG